MRVRFSELNSKHKQLIAICHREKSKHTSARACFFAVDVMNVFN